MHIPSDTLIGSLLSANPAYPDDELALDITGAAVVALVLLAVGVTIAWIVVRHRRKK
ncbi:MAG: hypothetical protein FWH11_14200 [Micrococcales bacterium]|nr:hypothetical protein [Micrococcales bacterium]